MDDDIISHQTESPPVARFTQTAHDQKLVRISSYLAICTGFILAIIKSYAFIQTGSLALLASLVDSIIDLLSSAVILFAIYHAQQPADREHRFGHGKAEPLAALAQAGFTCASGLYLFFEVGLRFLSPTHITEPNIGLFIMAVSLGLTMLLVFAQTYIKQRTGSVAVKADHIHYKGDILANFAVLFAIFTADIKGFSWIDPLVALIIALYILHAAWDVFMEALDMLMDRELPDHARQHIIETVKTYPGVIGVHDLRTRQAGPQLFIQMHLDLDGEQTLYQAHTIADQIEKKITVLFPGSEVIIHQDPVNVSVLPLK